VLHLTDRPAIVRDPDDPKQVRRAERLVFRRNKTLRIAIGKVLSTPEGRHVWRAIMDACRLTEPAFSTDALEMAYLQGRRAIGCELRADAIEIGVNLYLTLESEAMARQSREDSEIEAAHIASATSATEED